MEENLKEGYKSALLPFILFGIVAMSYGLFGGFVELWSWGGRIQILPLAPVFILPFLAFAVGSIVPSYINKDILKHSIIIGFVGSLIYMILAHLVGTIGGLGIAVERGVLGRDLYAEIFEFYETYLRIVYFPMVWAIITSTITFVSGAFLDPLKYVRSSMKTC